MFCVVQRTGVIGAGFESVWCFGEVTEQEVQGVSRFVELLMFLGKLLLELV